MAPNLSKFFIITLLMFFSSPSLASLVSPIFNSSETICNSTPHPSFCKSTLPYNKPGTIHDYGRISIQQSLSSARNFLSLVQNYLSLPSTLSIVMIRALEDCQILAKLNIDFLSQTLYIINASKDNTLNILLADELHASLSAVLTNQETCSNGLTEATNLASSIKNALIIPLSNGTMSYSVSLALFRHGWVIRDTTKGRPLTEKVEKQVFPNMGGNSKKVNPTLQLKIPSSDRRIHELLSLSGRKLLQATTMAKVVVNPDGTGNFTTINEAVAAAPNNTQTTDQYFVISIVSGVYEEYVSIPSSKKYLMMIGDGINQTVITGNRSVADGWTTFNSATFAVVAKGFVAVNITFRNTAGAIKQQAVAVRSGADLSTFYRCSFEGYQDTLYAHSLRQFYKECDIYGTVDFIFGNAAVVLQNCNIYPRLPLQGQFNAITAQGRTDPNQNTGTSIHNCSITAADDLASSNSTTKTYLGRPWKEYSRTVYMQSYMDNLIDPSGWTEWSGDFALSTLYYAEYDNSGPGSNTTNRVTWPGYHVINATDAVNFTVSNFILGDNWLPATGVPYTSGLL